MKLGKSPGNLACRLSSAPEKIKHGSSGRIGQYLKSRFRGICNRTVPHNV